MDVGRVREIVNVGVKWSTLGELWESLPLIDDDPEDWWGYVERKCGCVMRWLLHFYEVDDEWIDVRNIEGAACLRIGTLLLPKIREESVDLITVAFVRLADSDRPGGWWSHPALDSWDEPVNGTLLEVVANDYATIYPTRSRFS
jgi:hypothetical protein